MVLVHQPFGGKMCAVVKLERISRGTRGINWTCFKPTTIRKGNWTNYINFQVRTMVVSGTVHQQNVVWWRLVGRDGPKIWFWGTWIRFFINLQKMGILWTRHWQQRKKDVTKSTMGRYDKMIQTLVNEKTCVTKSRKDLEQKKIDLYLLRSTTLKEGLLQGKEGSFRSRVL